jgi:hypothetical protein
MMATHHARRPRAYAIVVLALTWIVVLCGGAPAVHADAADASALANEFASCAQQRGAADVILLLDQSLSLQDSDPEMVRRDASLDLARQLATYADAAGVELRMQVAGFDGVYHGNPWRDVPESIAPVLDEIRQLTDNNDLGPATDYWTALDGARQQFAKAANDRTPPACQMLLWFSDGAYDIDEKGSFGDELPYAPGLNVASDKAEIIQVGKDSICSAKQGPMNPMRATGVFVATVGLTVDSKPGDLDFLQQATEGSRGCGRTPMENRTAYLPADEADALTLAIAGLSGGELRDGPYDGRDATLPFGLDETVSRASVLAYAGPDTGGATFGLSGPDGAVVWWDSEAEVGQQVSGAAVTFEKVSDASGRFTIVRPADQKGWTGRWQVHVRAVNQMSDSARAQMVLTVTGDLRPEWSNPVEEAAIEDGLDLDLVLRTAAGREFTNDHPGIRVSLDYISQDGTTTALRSGLTTQDLREPVHVDLPSAPGEGRLSVRLDLVTDTEPPTQVVPVVTPYDLALRAAGDYPSVVRATFESASGVEPSRGLVTVTGPGCVWLDPTATDKAIQSLPDGVTQVLISAEAIDKDSCVALDAGATRDFRVSLTPSEQGNGSIVGTLAIRTAPAGAGSDIPVEVPYSADRTKAESVTTKWATLIGVTLLGLLLGAMPLLITRGRLARIKVRDQRSGPLQVARQHFAVSDGRVHGVQIRQSDLSPVTSGGADEVRRIDLDGVAVVPRVWGNPFAVPDCRVTSPRGAVVTSRSTGEEFEEARLPLALTGQWVAWPVGGDQFEAVVFLSSAEVIDSMLPATSQQVAERIEASAAVLRAAAQSGRAGDDAAETSALAPVPPASSDWDDTAASAHQPHHGAPGRTAPGGPPPPGPAAGSADVGWDSSWGAPGSSEPDAPGAGAPPNQW